MILTLFPIVLSILGMAGPTAVPPLLLHERQPRDSRCLVYTNKRYGFTFCLPQSWHGFTVDTSRWNGRVLGSDTTTLSRVIYGPELFIRHPLWTAAHPRQDIPILVFTHAQWELAAREELAVSAAPIGPTELGRTASYVFALPPRYDFALLTGWQEVQDILDHHPLHPL